MYQGDRTRKVGVVDSEYIVHMGLPTLGGVLGGHKVSNLTKPVCFPVFVLGREERRFYVFLIDPATTSH